jgi:hypothetical protein
MLTHLANIMVKQKICRTNGGYQSFASLFRSPEPRVDESASRQRRIDSEKRHGC